MRHTTRSIDLPFAGATIICLICASIISWETAVTAGVDIRSRNLVHLGVYFALSVGAVFASVFLPGQAARFISFGFFIITAIGFSATALWNVYVLVLILLAVTAYAAAIAPKSLVSSFLSITGHAFLIGTSSGIVWSQSPRVVSNGRLEFVIMFSVISSIISGILKTQLSQNQQFKVELDRLRDQSSRLAESNSDLQHYALLSKRRSAEQERLRIARDIHDTIGHKMTSVLMMAEAVESLLSVGAEQEKAIITKLKIQAQEVMAETRRAVNHYRTEASTIMPLANVLSEIVTTFSEATHVSIETSFVNLGNHYSPEIDSVMSRIIQEGLTNSYRHGGADRVTISIVDSGAELRLMVMDNGDGIAAPFRAGAGLEGMAERLCPLGGTLSPASHQYGFILRVTIPLNGTRQL